MTSSVIRAVDYDARAKRLEILFVSGRRYVYSGVPAAIHAALLAAPSVGGYFNAAIRDDYPYEELTDRAGD